MTEGIFMQLLVLVLMLMMSGKNANMKELKPIIEELGGGAAAEAFKQAEELSGMITAMQSLAKMSEPPAPPPETVDESAHGGGFPLAPIADIADGRLALVYSLC